VSVEAASLEPEGDRFLNRSRELDALRAIYRRKGAQLVAVYGRRRIGKTSLLVHWLGEVKARAVYWVAHRSTSQVLLASFSQALAPLTGTGDAGLTFSSWQAALEGAARLAAKAPLVLVIDELPYLLESVPSFATVLQAAWDHVLKRSHIRLMLAGSHYHSIRCTDPALAG
jgi:AAA+ ATPase superfamily predicted ATPase